jgi:hypothetical protein
VTDSEYTRWPMSGNQLKSGCQQTVGTIRLRAAPNSLTATSPASKSCQHRCPGAAAVVSPSIGLTLVNGTKLRIHRSARALARGQPRQRQVRHERRRMGLNTSAEIA